MPASIFNGDSVKLLKNKLKFKDGTEITATQAAANVISNSGSSTDNTIARYDGTNGLEIQTSSVTIDDSDVVSGITQLNLDNLRLDGNTISTTDTNGNLTIAPDGTGRVLMSLLRSSISGGMQIETLSGSLVATFGIGDAQASSISGSLTLSGTLISNTGAINAGNATNGIIINNQAGGAVATFGASNSTDVTFANDITVTGDLTVNGTTTTVNSATLEVTDANITVNNGGNQSSADTNDAGLTVEMSDATDAIIHYDSAAASFWKIGEVGSTVEIADISTAQTLTNKSIDSDNNTITNIVNADIKAAAAIALDKLAATTVSRALVSDGSGFVSAATTTATEIGYVNGVTSSIQTQLDSKLEQTVTTDSGTFNADADSITIVDTSGGAATITLPDPSTTEYVTIKDNGSGEVNNITINQNSSETIDGSTSHVISSNYGSAKLVSDGTNWYIL